MRCPDCSKFVAYEQEVEVQSYEASDGDGQGGDVNAEVEVRLNCQDCGTTLKSATIEAETGFDHECDPETLKEFQKAQAPDDRFKEGDTQFDIEDTPEAECDDRMETKDRHGNLIRNSRYMKHYYGFTMTATVTCAKCGEEIDVDLSGEEQASAFDEQV